MYRRILVGVDGSPAAVRALGEAIRLATEQPAMLRLLHIVEEPYVYDGEMVNVAAVAEGRAASGQRLLDEATAQVRQAGMQPEAILIGTDGRTIGGAIIAEATRWPADLIVLGTHGHGLVHRLLGGTTEEVIRATPVPVLLVRGV